MCGICGVLYTDRKREVEPDILSRMSEVISHRGPDDQGVYINDNVGLAARRLSIIDLESGHQPMHNEDGSIWIVFNGEIYNHEYLRRELAGKGHHFYTKSDTEVIIHLYEEEGEDYVHRLRGMFAIAIWDTREEKLLLTRDRMGIKPLHYRFEDGLLLFGSEIKTILQHPEAERVISLKALSDYLSYLYIPSPETIFKHIHKLPPGHMLRYQKGKISLVQYWDIRYTDENGSEKEYCHRLQELLRESIRMHLVSDVPLGVFLSGGMDSSLMVALMSEIANEPVKTFSAGFDVAAYDELDYAKVVAREFNTDHHEIRLRPDIVEALPQIVRHFDEPFADCSAVATYSLAEFTKRYVTVALSGDGGDELFAGYDWTRREKIINYYRKVPLGLRRLINSGVLRGEQVSGRHNSVLAKMGRFAHDSSVLPERGFFRRFTCFTEDMKQRLLSDWVKERLKGYDSFEVIRTHLTREPPRDFMDKMLRVDTKVYLPGDGLCKIDRMSMGHSLEARVPFLDHEFVEFAANIPFRYKLRGFTSKYVLKQAVRGILPPKTTKQRKQGFDIPVDAWFRQELAPLAEAMLLRQPESRKRGIFRPEYVKWILTEHAARRQDFGHHIYALLVFETWARLYLDRDANFNSGCSLTDLM